MERWPDKVKIVNKTESYSPGDILTLFYRTEPTYAIYKFPGAIFGISPKRVVEALACGDAIKQ